MAGVTVDSLLVFEIRRYVGRYILYHSLFSKYRVTRVFKIFKIKKETFGDPATEDTYNKELLITPVQFKPPRNSIGTNLYLLLFTSRGIPSHDIIKTVCAMVTHVVIISYGAEVNVER